VTDISREKNLEERLAISEKLAIYSELIAGIFHQINNPLVGVVNFSAILLERMNENDANRAVVVTIHAAALQCQRLIASLTKGFREPQSTFNRVSLRNILEHSIEEVQKVHGNSLAKVKLVKKIPDELPDVLGDFLQLDQVFQNFIDNAFQSMIAGGRLEIATTLEKSSGEILIQVSDTGCGIVSENLSKIFTPFFTTKKNTGGGLGLSFAYQVVKSHSGRIEVQSVVDQGTVFSIYLPLVEAFAITHC
jgi:two-component system NtrC family sensor kinase